MSAIEDLLKQRYTWGNPPVPAKTIPTSTGTQPTSQASPSPTVPGPTVSTRPPASSTQTITGSGITPVYKPSDYQEGALPQDVSVNLSDWAAQVSGTPQQRAQDAVDLEYNQRLRALQQESDVAGRDYAQKTNEQRIYGAEVDPRLQAIYGALGNSLQGNQQANQQTYQSAIDKIRGYYDEAGMSNQAMNEDVLGRINADASRLGTEAAVPSSIQRLMQDYAFNQGQNTNAKAGRSANLAQLAAQIGALDQNRVGAAASEGAQQRATLQNQVAKALGDLGVAGYNELGQYRMQQNGLEQDKAAAVRDELARIQQQDFENNSTARNNALNEFLQRSDQNMQEAAYKGSVWQDNRDFKYGQAQDNVAQNQWAAQFNRGNYEADRNYGLAQQQFGLDKTTQLGQLDIQRQQLQMDKEKLQAEVDSANSPEARTLAMLELQKTQAEIDKINAQTGAIQPKDAGTAKYPPGQAGLNAFYKTPSSWWGPQGAGPAFQSTVNQIIQDTLNHGTDPIDIGAGKTITDPYQYAMMLANVTHGDINPDALKTAVQIYFKGIQ